MGLSSLLLFTLHYSLRLSSRLNRRGSIISFPCNDADPSFRDDSLRKLFSILETSAPELASVYPPRAVLYIRSPNLLRGPSLLLVILFLSYHVCFVGASLRFVRRVVGYSCVDPANGWEMQTPMTRTCRVSLTIDAD